MADDSNLTPKEKLSAYQRWELASFADGGGGGVHSLRPGSDRDAGNAELARLKQEAQSEGYAAGYTAGMQRAADEQARLAELAHSLTTALAESENALAEHLLDLSLAITKQMLNLTLPVHRELLLPLVREAIEQLPQSARGGTLYLHPADVELVQPYLAAELGEHTFKLSGDARIERGGCRLAAGDFEIDATLPTRWARILSTLGRDDAWIDFD